MSPSGRGGGGVYLHFLTPFIDVYSLEKKGLARVNTLGAKPWQQIKT